MYEGGHLLLWFQRFQAPETGFVYRGMFYTCQWVLLPGPPVQLQGKTYKELASKVRDMQRKGVNSFYNLTVARINQTANEHPEFVGGTPALRYWPRGSNKQTKDFSFMAMEVEAIGNPWG